MVTHLHLVSQSFALNLLLFPVLLDGSENDILCLLRTKASLDGHLVLDHRYILPLGLVVSEIQTRNDDDTI